MVFRGKDVMDAEGQGFERVAEVRPRFMSAQQRGGPRGEAVGVEQVRVSMHAEALPAVAEVSLADEVMREPIAERLAVDEDQFLGEQLVRRAL